MYRMKNSQPKYSVDSVVHAKAYDKKEGFGFTRHQEAIDVKLAGSFFSGNPINEWVYFSEDHEHEIIESDISSVVREQKVTGETSDGYHTFNELYEHRIVLWIALCKCYQERVWRSKLHSDGSSYEGWFVLGMNKEKGEQITYHLPLSRWEDTEFAETLEKAPEYDGHLSNTDTLERISRLTTTTPYAE